MGPPRVQRGIGQHVPASKVLKAGKITLKQGLADAMGHKWLIACFMGTQTHLFIYVIHFATPKAFTKSPFTEKIY